MSVHELIAYADGRLVCGTDVMRCALGRSGLTSHKHERDAATPEGTFALREVLYRADRVTEPTTLLPKRIIKEEDIWCDDPSHPSYNMHAALPFDAHYERLWRDDHMYDIIVVLGYNDDPVVPGKGSAIFMHLARENYTPTEGCVALSESDLRTVLRNVDCDAVISIRQE